MANNLQYKVEVDGEQAKGAVKSFREQLREASKDVINLSEKFGATSIEAVNAAKKVAILRDTIGDAKSLADAFNPDAKFKAVTASLSGIAGGFGAVQGAMALFGAESENVQKTLLKVQSAMALSQGLQSIGESVDSFRQLGAVIKSTSLFQAAYNFIMGETIVATEVATVSTVEQTIALEAEAIATATVATATTGATIALRLFRAALVATGIGALIVGVGLLIQYMSSLSGATEKARKAQEALNKSFVEGSKKANTQYLQDLDDLKETELARAGDDENAKFQIEEKYRKQKIDALDAHNKKIKGLDVEAEGEIQKQIAKLRNEGIINKFANERRLRKEQQEIDLQLEVEASLREKKAIDAELAAYEKRKTAGKKVNDALIGADGMTATQRKEAEEEKIKTKEYSDAQYEKLSDKNDKNSLGKFLNKKTEELNIIQKTADSEKEIDAQKALDKKAQVQESMQLMSQLSDFVGQDTAAGKALGIATATINTYQGASEALKQKSTLPSPFDVIAKIANVAMIVGAGIKTVKSIASVRLPNGGGGGMPSLSNIAPIMPQIPTAQVTQLNQQSINDIGNQAVRAYVIESDVTSNQQRIAAIRQRARFS